MKVDNLTIVIPVKESPEKVNEFILANMNILSKYLVIVIDSGGGEEFKDYSLYINKEISMSQARKIGYSLVDTKYTLNLDVDTVLPEHFIEDALMIIECDSKVAVLALDYENCQGHYAFGTSLWKTDILKKLYDYIEGNTLCECVYMWRKVLQNKNKIETLPYRAIHLKEMIK